jgi:ketosteroid isomerase-like protein
MTSGEEEALVRRFTESWVRDDLDAILACIDPDMEFDWTESISPFRDVYTGREGLERFWEEMRDTFDDFTPRIDDVVACGAGRLVTRVTVFGRARSSGIELEASGGMLWTVRDGRIVQGKLFQSEEDALAAAGSP